MPTKPKRLLVLFALAFVGMLVLALIRPSSPQGVWRWQSEAEKRAIVQELQDALRAHWADFNICLTAPNRNNNQIDIFVNPYPTDMQRWAARLEKIIPAGSYTVEPGDYSIGRMGDYSAAERLYLIRALEGYLDTLQPKWDIRVASTASILRLLKTRDVYWIFRIGDMTNAEPLRREIARIIPADTFDILDGSDIQPLTYKYDRFELSRLSSQLGQQLALLGEDPLTINIDESAHRLYIYIQNPKTMAHRRKVIESIIPADAYYFVQLGTE